MSYQATIASAMTTRGLIAETFTCACCKEDQHRDDHMRGIFLDEFEAKVRERFGDVCIGCADDIDKGVIEIETEDTYCKEYDLDCRWEAEASR